MWRANTKEDEIMRLNICFAISILMIVVWSFSPRPAFACSCAELGVKMSYLVHSDVFAGTTGQQVNLPASPGSRNSMIRAVEMEVETVWKGAVGKSTHLVMESSCSYFPGPGQRVVVFANPSGPYFDAAYCSSSGISPDHPDMAVLGLGWAPGSPWLGKVLRSKVFIAAVSITTILWAAYLLRSRRRRDRSKDLIVRS